MSRRVSALPTTPEEIVAHLRGPSSAPPGYQLNRVILCNYWHFGLLTFDIPRDHALRIHAPQYSDALVSPLQHAVRALVQHHGGTLTLAHTRVLGLVE